MLSIVREHESILVGAFPGQAQVTVGELEALDRTQRSLGVTAFRWTGQNQIKATQYVGILAASTIRLEILPKIVGCGASETRRALIGMIKTAWNVPRQFTRLAVAPQKLACQFDEFTADTDLNRLLLCAATLLRRRSIHSDTQRRLNELAVHFEDVQSVSVSDALGTNIVLDRSSRRGETVVTLSRLLLSSTYQATHRGTYDGIALLFDMNLLFESYVASLARRVCVPLGYTVRTQGPHRCLVRTDDEQQQAFHTKPDLHIERDGFVMILDTKWKHVDPAVQILVFHRAMRTRCIVMRMSTGVLSQCCSIRTP